MKKPEIDWEDKINETRFTIDQFSRRPMTSHVFVLNQNDRIDVKDSKHSYVFKRSQFYEKFVNSKSRIRKDLETYYSSKNYYVNLFKNEKINKWCLKLSWDNNEIQSC